MGVHEQDPRLRADALVRNNRRLLQQLDDGIFLAIDADRAAELGAVRIRDLLTTP